MGGTEHPFQTENEAWGLLVSLCFPIAVLSSQTLLSSLCSCIRLNHRSRSLGEFASGRNDSEIRYPSSTSTRPSQLGSGTNDRAYPSPPLLTRVHALDSMPHPDSLRTPFLEGNNLRTGTGYFSQVCKAKPNPQSSHTKSMYRVWWGWVKHWHVFPLHSLRLLMIARSTTRCRRCSNCQRIHCGLDLCFTFPSSNAILQGAPSPAEFLHESSHLLHPNPTSHPWPRCSRS